VSKTQTDEELIETAYGAIVLKAPTSKAVFKEAMQACHSFSLPPFLLSPLSVSLSLLFSCLCLCISILDIDYIHIIESRLRDGHAEAVSLVMFPSLIVVMHLQRLLQKQRSMLTAMCTGMIKKAIDESETRTGARRNSQPVFMKSDPVDSQFCNAVSSAFPSPLLAPPLSPSPLVCSLC